MKPEKKSPPPNRRTSKPGTDAYAKAGVDVALGNTVKSRIPALVKNTHGPEVIGGIGGFGGLFRPDLEGYREPVLVSSVDSVGTKLKVAFALDRHDTVGQCIVNHCIDDIATLGAKPLFFLDYLGAEKLDPKVFTQIVKGLAKACREGGCALIGGETAQLPGMYFPGEYDLVGCIVGIVDRKRMIDGATVKPGDVILGLPSNGLHTNGYTLARKILFEQMNLEATSKLPGLAKPVGAELLRVHRNYQPSLANVRPGLIKGLAHITGGGFIDNIPRVLPETVDAEIDTAAWRVPALFRILQENGGVARDEMYRVFNMGIGMVAICSATAADEVAGALQAKPIGRIVKGNRTVTLI
jgi:phosphoribosylformylglycinamidine cyclo-ligase